MKIEAGKYYRTRGGHVVGPTKTTQNFGPYTFWVDMDEDFCWTPDGDYGSKPHDLDLVSEVYVSDTPPDDAPAPETIRLDPRTEWKLFRQMGPHELVTNASVPMLETKTLRDEFVIAALTGFMADHTAPDRPSEFFAGLAYKYANAMMEARKK